MRLNGGAPTIGVLGRAVTPLGLVPLVSSILTISTKFMIDRRVRTAYNQTYYQRNKARIDAKNKAYQQTAQGKLTMSRASIKKQYGITLDDKKKMYEDQKGLCKVCDLPLPENFREAHVDHDHETKKIRGLLHQKCNHFVGHLEKNPDLIDKALYYLKSSRSNHVTRME